MRKIVPLLFVLLLLVGCVKESVPVKDYFVGTEEYLHEIDNFKKDIPKLVQAEERDLSKLNLLEDRIEEMKEEIQLFKNLVPPVSLKREHDMALTYSTSFEFLLNQSLKELKKENFFSKQSKDYLMGDYITNIQKNLSDLIKYSLIEEKTKDV